MQRSLATIVGSASAVLGLTVFAVTAQAAAPIKNIVLVHGAWVDGSGWKPVYDILTRDGFKVSIVQEPETSFANDVAATKRTLDLQDGPAILVGHSYGGSVITEAGVHPKVAGLVYVAAHAPDVGEDEGALGKKTPSVLGKTAGAIKKTPDGFTYLDPALFPKLFAPDLHGSRSRAGPSSPVTIRSSVRSSSAGITSARTARRQRSRVRATPSINRIPKRSRRSSRMRRVMLLRPGSSDRLTTKQRSSTPADEIGAHEGRLSVD